MLATATHDHKRGEDTRARLAVLSEIPGEWETAITRWTRLNAIIRQDAGPDMADELMLYQTLVSAWPFGLKAEDAEGLAAYTARLEGWLEKSLREAKRHSEWAAPNEAYETAAKQFLSATLDPARPVLGEIITFAERLGAPGAINGLAQTLLRLTAPGVPDLYQGTEFWDLSLVDPDNRRPVDFAARQAALTANLAPAALLADWQSGAVKQAIIARALALRARQPALFAHGIYKKLEAEGAQASHVLAFSRGTGRSRIITVATRLGAQFVTDTPLVPAATWGDTRLPRTPGAWTEIRTGNHFSGQNMNLSAVLAQLPIALLAAA
jgi:(1->4)-alpha-D-glucan 1-alpha-D-glucosylmutase